MPRIDPDVRRQAIIEAAFKLFRRDGFDSVRVDDILEEVGLSKGGFYHHFKSREDILRQIVVNETVATVESLSDSLVRDDPIAALAQLFLQGSTNQGADIGVLGSLESFGARSVYLDELEQQLSLHLKPYLVKVIDQGVASKVFRTVDSEATAEIVLAVNDHGNRSAVLGKLKAEKLQAYNQTALEVLGMHLGIEGRLQELFSAPQIQHP